MDIKAGTRLRSTVCAGEFIVVRPPKSAVRIECGGAPMAEFGAGAAAAGAQPQGAGLLTGKRYFDPDSGAELLCSKAGQGPLTADGRVMAVKDAKRLPSTD